MQTMQTYVLEAAILMDQILKSAGSSDNGDSTSIRMLSIAYLTLPEYLLACRDL